MRALTGWIFSLFLVGVAPPAYTMGCPLLIVTSQSAPVDTLPQTAIRRLYLGIPYQTQMGSLKPLRNISDDMLQEVFLQKILFMSKNAYQRILASRLVQRRAAGPARYEDLDELIQDLQSNPLFISYIWYSQLPANNQLKVLLTVPCENY